MYKQIMLLILSLLLCAETLAAKSVEKGVCARDNCHAVNTKGDVVNVHIIAHTHDDVGWIKTVEQYYSEEWFFSEDGSVRTIFRSFIDSLLKDKNRRFMYVESAFLFRWWKEQNDTTKEQFKELVNTGRLELVSGGWSMNDEATTHYQSIIDQFTLGLHRLKEVFGDCGRPRVGWQIDPFGHSSEMASIFAQLGFDGLFLGRVDNQDKMQRFATKSAEFLWQGSNSLGKSSEIFTSILYNTYWPPNGFCFDILCHDQLIDYNIDWKWANLVSIMKQQAAAYQTNNIILTMGGDFHYMKAEEWFRNLDKLIGYGNKQRDSKFNLFYSTPSCYLKAVREEESRRKLNWPTKNDDFFPYAMESHSYWTGYYTSRPTLKRFERVGNNFLQVCKQLYTLGHLNNTYQEKLNSLKKAMAIMQHHDAVSGTQKQHVANDYSNILSKGIADCGAIASEALHNFNPHIKTFESCLLLNISQCDFTEYRNKFIVTVYNPLSRPVDHYVRIPVQNKYYAVKDSKNRILPIQLIPIPYAIIETPGRHSLTKQELIFLAKQIPPLGFKSFYVKSSKKQSLNKRKTDLSSNKGTFVSIDKRGFLSNITINEETFPIFQEFMFYQGALHPFRPSGAYIFHPKDNYAKSLTNIVNTKFYTGPLITEVHQIFSNWVSQIIRTYHNEEFVELQWLIGPLPRSGGYEMISRFKTNLNTKSTFYTDSNGREMLQRVKNFRPTWKFQTSQPVASNYYPITSKILIRDEKERVEVAILTDRAQGGTSINDGEIELMVHRNCRYDDSLGVDEVLNEFAFGKGLVARGSHYLIAGKYNNTKNGLSALEKDIAQRKLLDAWTFLSPISSYQIYKNRSQFEYSGLKQVLPKNIQILTLEPWDTNRFLLRLEHVFAKDEDSVLSKPVEIDIKHLFAAFNIVDLRETTLGGNQWLDESKPMEFGKHDTIVNISKRSTLKHKQKNLGDSKYFKKFQIMLKPMQIRTFIISIDLVS